MSFQSFTAVFVATFVPSFSNNLSTKWSTATKAWGFLLISLCEFFLYDLIVILCPALSGPIFQFSWFFPFFCLYLPTGVYACGAGLLLLKTLAGMPRSQKMFESTNIPTSSRRPNCIAFSTFRIVQPCSLVSWYRTLYFSSCDFCRYSVLVQRSLFRCSSM